jgi:hypothetical protein
MREVQGLGGDYRKPGSVCGLRVRDSGLPASVEIMGLAVTSISYPYDCLSWVLAASGKGRTKS